MTIRVVQMTFHPDSVDSFLELFDLSAEKIRAVPGCHHLELWQDSHFKNILSTYSLWEDEDSLNDYRKSALFISTWARAKSMFAAPPLARSYNALRSPTTGK